MNDAITVYEREPGKESVKWSPGTGSVRVLPDGEWMHPEPASPMQKLLDHYIEKHGENGVVLLQIVFKPGHLGNQVNVHGGGVRRHPEIEGVYQMLVRGQTQGGKEVAVDRDFEPDAVQIVEKLTTAEMPSIVTPGGGMGLS